jgi:hypothetical protein
MYLRVANIYMEEINKRKKDEDCCNIDEVIMGCS